MKKSLEVIFNLILWSIITYMFYYYAKTNAHIAANAVNNYGMFHIPYLDFVVFFTLVPPIVNFYLFYLILIPKLLVRKKIALFFTFAIISSVLIGYAYRLTYGANGTHLGNLVFFTVMALFWGIIGSAIKGIFLWIDSLAERRTLEKEKLISKNALLLLQAQINPHFLFNSLNNIDILIEESPKVASEYLKKLSDILRYVLYETKEDKTDLVKEIDQIKSYIDLQKIRTSNPHYVNFNIVGKLNDQKIAPMIFIPFIENAFKHSKNKTIDNAIEIEFVINDKKVKMTCKNYYESTQLEIIKNEGLGNETMKQRLNLLYPKNHKLVIYKTDNWFNVTLSIDFNDVN
jgi:two-component system, LytTR family, sensor kinase